jgi:tetratricopeptide (TPR) repeat protein
MHDEEETMGQTPASELIAEADALYGQGKLEQAAQLYEAAIAAEPDLAWPYSRLGGIMAQRGNGQEAEALLTRALELDPELPQAHSNLGNLYYTRDEFEKAAIQYRAAVAIDPANPLYHENLHAAYKKLRNYSESIREIKQANRLRNTAMKDQTQKERAEMKRKSPLSRGCGTSVLLLLAVVSLAAILLH